jgi:uncharacterized protein (DUF1800 family)
MATTTPADVTHLWRRAAFGIDATGADARAGTSWSDLVDELVDPPAAPMARTPALDDPAYSGMEMFRALAVGARWLDHMAATPTPGAEKLTWFWHGHFTTSLADVMWGEGISRQLTTLRSGAQGSFRSLLGSMVVDSAMGFYLDNVSNVRGKVNENLGRELLELFTVGVEHYTQTDVVGASKSLTGHNVDWLGTLTPRYYPEWHDNSTKTVLGSTGNFDANGLCDVICNSTNRVHVARRVARKLWSAWAYPNPSTTLVNDIASTALSNGFSGKSFARAVLRHSEFRSATARSALVRTPVEFLIALAKVSGATPSQLGASGVLGAAGHHPFLPPNVSGWPEANSLCTPQTWWQLGTLHSTAAAYAHSATPARLPATASLAPEDAARAALRWAGIVDPAPETISSIAAYVTTIRGFYPPSEPVALAMAATLSPDFATGGGT